MKIKLLTVSLLMYCLQANAWSDSHVKAINDACVKNGGDFPYKNIVSYCSCTVEMTVQLFSVDQIVKMQKDGTIKKHKNYLKLVDYCTPKLFE